MMIALGFGCCAPNIPRPTQATVTHHVCHRGTIRIAIDPTFDAEHIQLAVDAIPVLSELGVTPVIVLWNDPRVDVRVTYWNNNNTNGQRCHDHKLGIHTWGTNYVLVDPQCMQSNNQFQVVVVHEIGHWLGLRHVCDTDGQTTDVCSDVGRGEAILNPYLSSDHHLHFTDLDRREYERACTE